MTDPDLASASAEPRPSPAPWVWVLAALLFAVGVYGLGLERMPLEGEETRRARFATEMIESGDWVVTTQQRVPFVDRPPLQYWAISAVYLATGDQSVWSLRLSAVAATVLTVLVILWYAAPIMGWPFAAFAGAAFTTMGLVLDLGARAETESVFTLVLAGALLVWHGGLIRGWPEWAAWTIGYSLAALATLAKGTQAPVAFVGATVLWLVLQRRWSTLLSPGHVLGILSYGAILGAWLVPLYQRLGLDSLREAFVEPGRERFDAPAWQFLKHWALFPAEALVGMLPWSPMLLGVPSVLRRPRGDLGRSAALYLLLAMGVLLAPLWLAPWARGRYFMPAFPLAAVLMGLIVAHGAASARRSPWRMLRVFACGLGMLFLAGAAALALSPLIEDDAGPLLGAAMSAPGWINMVIAVSGVVAGAVLVRAAATRTDTSLGRARMAVAFCVAALVVGLLSQTIVVHALTLRTVDVRSAVLRARSAVPGSGLISIGLIHHRFAYYWNDHIPLVPREPAESLPDRVPPGSYFCVNRTGQERPALTFEWNEVASIAMDAYREDAEDWVVIGRRTLDGAPASPVP